MAPLIAIPHPEATMPRARRLSLLSAIFLLAGCGGQELYREQIELVKRQQDRQEEVARAADQQFAAMAARCPEADGACVLGVAMARAFTLRDANQPVHMPAPPRSGMEVFADVAKAVLPPLVGGAVAWRQSDNSVRVSERQFEFYSSAFGAMRDVAAGAQPNISVGGNWGDTTSFGDHFTGGDRSETTTTNSGTLTSGDGNRVTVGDRNHNRGRQDSPGPIDNSDNSDNSTHPPPAPPPECTDPDGC